jgi:hypothetical protein
MGGMALTALFLRGPWTGAVVVGLLVLFSLARGLCSISSKDVIGKTVPKKRRGRLLGYTAALSGILTLGLGLGLVAMIGGEASPCLFAGLLFSAAGLWLAAVSIFARIAETPGATSGGRNGWREALHRLDILRRDPPFRRFVLTRALLVSTALAGPYYVVLARESGGGGELLGFFVLAGGLASSLSSALWGRYADRSSRSVLIAGAAIASGLGVIMFTLASGGVLSSGGTWIAPAAFFVLSVAHSGVRIGRKTYIIDLGGGEKRTDYIAVSNTVIGLLILLSGSLTALTPLLGAAGMLLLISLLGLAGSLLAVRLEEA